MSFLAQGSGVGAQRVVGVDDSDENEEYEVGVVCGVVRGSEGEGRVHCNPSGLSPADEVDGEVWKKDGILARLWGKLLEFGKGTKPLIGKLVATLVAPVAWVRSRLSESFGRLRTQPGWTSGSALAYREDLNTKDREGFVDDRSSARCE